MTTFGRKLRGERKDRGIGLDEIAAATKISRHYLEALEQDDFERLPGDVFTKGYVRAYAQHLGVAPEILVEEYERDRAGRLGTAPAADDGEVIREMSRILTESAGDRPARGRGRTIAWVVGCVVVVAAGTWWVAIRRTPTPEASRPERRAPAIAAQRETPTAAIPELPVAATESEQPITTDPSREDPAPSARRDVTPPPEVRREVAQPPELVAAPATEPRTEPASSTEADTRTGPGRIDEPEAESGARPESMTEIEAATAPPTGTGRPEAEVETTPDAGGPALLKVPDYGVGTGVANRQLVGAGSRFTEGQDVWFWTRVLGGGPGETITHVWIHEGRESMTVELRIGGAHWRTQSRRTLRPGSAGQWAVEARDATGTLLARTDFTCDP
jgi:cytoskeleton protein RodZ